MESGMTDEEYALRGKLCDETEERHVLSERIVEKVFTGLVRNHGLTGVTQLVSDGTDTRNLDQPGLPVPGATWRALKGRLEEAIHLATVHYLQWLVDALPSEASELKPDQEIPLPECTPEAQTKILQTMDASRGEASPQAEILLELVIETIREDACLELPGIGCVSFGLLTVDPDAVLDSRAVRAYANRPSLAT